MEGLLVIPGLFILGFVLSFLFGGFNAVHPKRGLVNEETTIYPKGHPRRAQHLQ